MAVHRKQVLALVLAVVCAAFLARAMFRRQPEHPQHPWHVEAADLSIDAKVRPGKLLTALGQPKPGPVTPGAALRFGDGSRDTLVWVSKDGAVTKVTGSVLHNEKDGSELAMGDSCSEVALALGPPTSQRDSAIEGCAIREYFYPELHLRVVFNGGWFSDFTAAQFQLGDGG